MPESIPSLSTDLLAAYVELAHEGSLRGAAAALHITEQGLRNRLIALEERLGVELYAKRRGPKRGALLTEQGRQFLPHAVAFLERARELCDRLRNADSRREIHIAASQYLIMYVLIDALRHFSKAYPYIQVRLSTRTEREIEAALLDDPTLALGVAAPHELPAELSYTHLFSMNWSFMAPPGHRLLRARKLGLKDFAGEPLILFEKGSTGRQHVIDAFHQHGLSPKIHSETTNTEIIVRMVEAKIGVSIVPLLPSGAVTRGRKVGTRNLGNLIRPINSGILTRRGEQLSAAAQKFAAFIAAHIKR